MQLCCVDSGKRWLVAACFKGCAFVRASCIANLGRISLYVFVCLSICWNLVGAASLLGMSRVPPAVLGTCATGGVGYIYGQSARSSGHTPCTEHSATRYVLEYNSST